MGGSGTQAARPGEFTVVIADDHEIVRSGLRAALETPAVVADTTIRVVAEAGDGFETLAAVKQHHPDLLLLDLTMPLSSGAEVYNEVRRWSPETKTVVFSSVMTGGLLSHLVEAGVEGMFAKGGSNALLYQKLPLILRGGRFIAPDILDIIQDRSGATSLTPRERQTMHMVLRGRTTKEIAEAQGISPRTAEKHRASLMAKLEVRSVAELMAQALKDGLIDGEGGL